MRSLLSWPKRRRLGELEAELAPGRLVLLRDDGTVVLDCDNVDELRAFAMMAHAAAVDHDLLVQESAVKASLARRHARIARGGTAGLRSRPFVDPPEPPAHMEARA